MVGVLQALALQTVVVMVTFLSQVFEAEVDIVCLCEMEASKTWFGGRGAEEGMQSVIWLFYLCVVERLFHPESRSRAQVIKQIG